MKQLSGNYSEIELLKTDRGKIEPADAVRRTVRLSGHKWEETLQRLAAIFSDDNASSHSVVAAVAAAKGAAVAQIEPGLLSPLQEDDERYYATVLIEKATDRLKLATLSWLKEPLESWLARVENQLRTDISAPSSSYGLPTISEGGECIEDTWTATSADSAPLHRESHTAVWTGSEMIVGAGLVRAR